MDASSVYLCLVVTMVIGCVQGDLQYMDQRVENHGYVDRYDMVTNGRRLRCITAVISCCTDSSQGTWIAPDGSDITTSTGDIYQVYQSRAIVLVITSRSVASGIYECKIQTNDMNDNLDSYFVGLYPTNGGMED